MSTCKIQFTFGSFSFSGEREESWVSAQIEKLLNVVPGLHVQPDTHSKAGSAHQKSALHHHAESHSVGTLANYLKEHNATAKQTRKFLATAAWIHHKNGGELLTTREISKALRDTFRPDNRLVHRRVDWEPTPIPNLPMALHVNS